MRVQIARDELRRLRELTQAINRLEREITELVGQIAPQLLSEPGFGPLIAAKLVGEIAGAQRFATPAKLARAAGVAPIPASSGNTRRQRLDRGGNRQINAALHRVIVTRARCHPPTRDYITRRRSEGKSTREAIRCLKRYLARQVWRLLQTPRAERDHPQSLDTEATQGAVRARRCAAPPARRKRERRGGLAPRMSRGLCMATSSGWGQVPPPDVTEPRIPRPQPAKCSVGGAVCQRPSVSPHGRPSVLPDGGHVFSPLVAIGSPQRAVDAKLGP